MEDVIVYNYAFIKELSENFNAELDEETINNLLQIKKNNKFIRRRSPLRLKYKISTANTWRSERENQELSNEDRLINNLTSCLNKLSEHNYEVILKDVQMIFNDNNEDLKLISKLICEKAMVEKIYSDIYAKLIRDLYKSNDDCKIVEYVRDNCNDFFKNTVSAVLTELKEDIDNYEKICEILKNKAIFTGGFIFIANLFKCDIINYDLVKEYYDSLVEYTRVSPKEQITRYLDAIISVIESCGKDLEAYDKENFKENFMNIVYDLIKDKKRVAPKHKFKLMDIIEIYENGWEKPDDEGWHQVK